MVCMPSTWVFDQVSWEHTHFLWHYIFIILIVQPKYNAAQVFGADEE